MTKTARRLGWAAAILAAAALALPWAVPGVLWHRELNPVLRGRLLAEDLGCPSCHRPYKGVEIPNPGSRWGTVPAFGSGNGFMYEAATREGIEDFVRFGAPRNWLDDDAIAARLDRQRLRMPAYGERLSDAEIADLVAWVGAVEGIESPGGPQAEDGRRLAREKGCPSCHGIEGSGGLANPGSLGGFVPGFLGGNFADLVAGREEFDEWVRSGTSRRLEKSPVVRWFWRRQALSMPAYDALSDAELDALWAWIEAARAPRAAGPPTAD